MINENKIREACSSDRERGFKMLMNSFQVPIYNYIRRLVVSHEDAEDVLQEVFIRIFRHIDQFREESSLSTWIYRIATNESLRLLNSRKEEGVISAEDVQEELMSKLKASDYIDYENELAVKFQEAILSLPEKQRLVFNLRYYDELEYDEIARVLDSKVDTLKVNYHYAKEKIKEYTKGLRETYLDKVKGFITESDYLDFSQNFTVEKEKFEQLVLDTNKKIELIEKKIQNGDNRHQLIEQYTNLDHLDREIVEKLIDYILVGKKDSVTKEVPIEIHWNF